MYHEGKMHIRPVIAYRSDIILWEFLLLVFFLTTEKINRFGRKFLRWGILPDQGIPEAYIPLKQKSASDIDCHKQKQYSNPYRTFNLGYWNVLSLYIPGALKLLLGQTEHFKLDIGAIEEIRWTSQDTLEKRRHIHILYSLHEYGVGFLVG